MSCCTSIVLIASPGEYEAMAKLSAILAAAGFPPLAETSDAAASYQKPMHIDVWQGAYNYFAASDVFEAFVRKAANWSFPEDVVCVIHHESYMGVQTIMPGR